MLRTDGVLLGKYDIIKIKSKNKRVPFYHYNNNVQSNSAHHVERYFLISLHCFIIRKTSMNAAGPTF